MNAWSWLGQGRGRLSLLVPGLLVLVGLGDSGRARAYGDSNALAPAPDYAQPDAWAARPGQASHALDTPMGVRRANSPSVPVFFIHPTTYLRPVLGNAAYDIEGRPREQLDLAVLRFQASVFNGCCRIYAPRYRQASLRAITGRDAASHAVDDIAYGDVERAFERFLDDIHGAPFVLAAHSQGSIHALRLLQDKIIGTSLQRRLIVAYLPGVALPMAIEDLGLPVCRSAAATGCVVSWNSVRAGHDDRRRRDTAQIWWRGRYQDIAGRPLVCVNPLDWQLDGTAPPADNLGAVYSAGRWAPLPAPVPAVTGAACRNGLLEVDPRADERRHFSDALTLFGIYHDFDYDLYYLNIRRNVAQRIEAYERHAP